MAVLFCPLLVLLHCKVLGGRGGEFSHEDPTFVHTQSPGRPSLLICKEREREPMVPWEGTLPSWFMLGPVSQHKGRGH